MSEEDVVSETRAGDVVSETREGDVVSETREEDVVSPYADGDDTVVEAALRPKRLAEFVGQERVREQLGLVLAAAPQRGRPPGPGLLSGSPRPGQATPAAVPAPGTGA